MARAPHDQQDGGQGVLLLEGPSDERDNCEDISPSSRTVLVSGLTISCLQH